MRYLSEEWLAAADAAMQANASSAPDEPLVIDQHVAGAISYRVKIVRDDCSIATISDEGSATVDSDAVDSETVDATFRQDLATAAAVAQGTTDAHQAFLLGHITFVGNVDVLIDRRDSFTWLERALAPLLADTTFD